MINSTWRFRSPLAIELATASGVSAAQQRDKTPDVKVEAGTVQPTMVRPSEMGTPIERFWIYRKVRYADFYLATTWGATELMSRITVAAKEACEQVHTADPIDLSDMDDTACVTTATDGALRQAKAAVDQQGKRPSKLSPPK